MALPQQQVKERCRLARNPAQKRKKPSTPHNNAQ